MNKSSSSNIRRLVLKIAAALLCVLLLWQMSWISRLTIANQYAERSVELEERADSSLIPAEQRFDFLSDSLAMMNQARTLDPSNAEYALRSGVLINRQLALSQNSAINRQQVEALQQELREELEEGLASSPTHALLWARLAIVILEQEGISEDGFEAFEKTLFYGPLETESLLVNALYTFYGWDRMTTEQQQRGWELIPLAMQRRELARTIRQYAELTGWHQQLDRVLEEQRMMREAALDDQ